MKVSKKVESNAVKSGQRFELADAWREAGLDELEVAQTMAGLIKRLTGKEDSKKTLLDAGKESIRVLDLPKLPCGQARVMFRSP